MTNPPIFNPGDSVRFSLFCFGAKRSAVGCVLPSSGDIPNTVTLEYRVALPPVEKIRKVGQRGYPEGGILSGIVQMPLNRIKVCASPGSPGVTLEPLPQLQQLSLF